MEEKETMERNEWIWVIMLKKFDQRWRLNEGMLKQCRSDPKYECKNDDSKRGRGITH